MQRFFIVALELAGMFLGLFIIIRYHFSKLQMRLSTSELKIKDLETKNIH